MKHLQLFSLFKARASRLPSGLTSEQESFLNRYTQGSWSVNPTTGLVDVQGNFDCSGNSIGKKLNSLQGISFGHVSGIFLCHYNHLTTLAGAPTKVDVNFNCNYNQLTTLAGAPTMVGGGFHCHSNQLTTLAGAPTTVGGDFRCYDNRLTTLAGAPTTVGGDFYCDAFRLEYFRESEKWNPVGWEKISVSGTNTARSLMQTLPQLQPEFWLNLRQKDRRTFNRIWVDYRRNPGIRKTLLYREVEGALSGQARSNLDGLQDLQDLGI
jgi:hypothetical protein